jgi:hypothetical protein
MNEDPEPTTHLRDKSPPIVVHDIRDGNLQATMDEQIRQQMEQADPSASFTQSTIGPHFLDRNAHVHEWVFGTCSAI